MKVLETRVASPNVSIAMLEDPDTGLRYLRATTDGRRGPLVLTDRKPTAPDSPPRPVSLKVHMLAASMVRRATKTLEESAP